MRLSSLGYLIRQGWKNLVQNRLMSLASVGVLTACLIITGVASLLSVNINRVVDYFGNQNEITVFLVEGLGDEEIEEIGRKINDIENVLEYELTTKGQAYEKILDWMEDYAGLLTGLDHLFPASYSVTVGDLSLIEQTNAQLRTFAGVDDTYVPNEVADIMVGIKTGVNVGGWGLVAVLAIVSVIIISNTIRLTVFARRREISIMKYVGATNTFIRMPFFVEGMTVGAISGLLASGIVIAAYNAAFSYVAGSYNILAASIMGSLLPVETVWPVVLIGFVAFGVVVGGIGTSSSIRKHLKV